MTNYFTDEELRCKCGCNNIILSPAFRKHLNALREAFGKSMVINSCCRCFEHNKAIGGHPKSLHLMNNPYHKTKGTCACDINISDYSQVDIIQLCSLAYASGFSVGINLEKKFIHLDLRSYYTGLPAVIFSY